MGREENGAAAVAEAAQLAFEQRSRERVEATRRLIEDLQPFVGQEACGKPELLRHAFRVGARRSIERRDGEIESGESLFHALFLVRLTVQLGHITQKIAA